MSLLTRLGTIVEECKKEYEERKEMTAPSFACFEQVGTVSDLAENVMALGDNLEFMHYLRSEGGLTDSLKLIYIDPPFFSKADYAAEIRISSDKVKLPQMKQKAYRDTWENGMEEYLHMLTARLLLMRELLAEDGGIWVHLDWHVVHYVKIIMDELFGEKNFINEVIWNYKSGGVSNRHFARKHDTLLYYAKSKAYYFKVQKEKSYNRGYKPYRFKGVKEYKDALGWYTMVNKKDVWQIDMVGRTSAERTGYATQKPELLIEQILESCTQEGDLCADFFAGSGTLASVAERMGRRWICCDAGVLAVAGSKRRLAQRQAVFSCYYPEDSADFFTGKGKISADVALQDNGISDTIILSVSLTGYVLSSLASLPIGEKQLKAVKKILKKEALSLVDFWTVDFDFDGKIFRPELFLFREKGKLTVRGEVLRRRPQSGEAFTVGIKVYDVFGGCGFLTTKVEI